MNENRIALPPDKMKKTEVIFSYKCAKCHTLVFYDDNYCATCGSPLKSIIDIVIVKKRDTGRISKRDYYLKIAEAVALRSTCIRRQYGAVIVKDDQIIATGYNGSARGEDNCCDVGTCWREEHGIPHGEQYEKCVAVHAEDNAISQAGRAAIGATLYLAGFENGRLITAKPCLMCERKIKNAGIVEVVGSLESE